MTAGYWPNEILDLLADTPGPRMAEVGVCRGDASRTLLARRRDLHLTMVDHWTEGKGNDHRIWRALASTEFADDRRTVLHGASTAMARRVDPASLDCVFIDADHSRDAVFDDLVHWYPAVKPGGLVAGHDWEADAATAKYEVAQAVTEYADRLGLGAEIQHRPDATWFFWKPRARPDSLEDYVDLITRRQVFHQANYGDGEWQCLLNTPGAQTNSQGGRYTPDLRNRLLRTFEHPRPGMLLGNNPGRKMSPDVSAWIAAHARNLPWVRKEVLESANTRGRLAPFLEAMRTRRVVLVGPAHLQALPPAALEPATRVEVPLPGAQDRIDEIAADVVRRIEQTHAGVVLISAGMATGAIIYRLIPRIGDQCTLLDTGALWDPYCGHYSRKAYQRPTWPDIMKRNLSQTTPETVA